MERDFVINHARQTNVCWNISHAWFHVYSGKAGISMCKPNASVCCDIASLLLYVCVWLMIAVSSYPSSPPHAVSTTLYLLPYSIAYHHRFYNSGKYTFGHHLASFMYHESSYLSSKGVWEACTMGEATTPNVVPSTVTPTSLFFSRSLRTILVRTPSACTIPLSLPKAWRIWPPSLMSDRIKLKLFSLWKVEWQFSNFVKFGYSVWILKKNQWYRQCAQLFLARLMELPKKIII